MIYKIERDDDENQKNERHVPNDYPIPTKFPDSAPAPMKGPNRGPVPRRLYDTPEKGLNKNPRIRVLNLQS